MGTDFRSVDDMSHPFPRVCYVHTLEGFRGGLLPRVFLAVSRLSDAYLN